MSIFDWPTSAPGSLRAARRHADCCDVYEFGAGDNGFGAFFHGGTTRIAATIGDSDLYDCSVYEAPGRWSLSARPTAVPAALMPFRLVDAITVAGIDTGYGIPVSAVSQLFGLAAEMVGECGAVPATAAQLAEASVEQEDAWNVEMFLSSAYGIRGWADAPTRGPCARQALRAGLPRS